jgi:hypothetical protein
MGGADTADEAEKGNGETTKDVSIAGGSLIIIGLIVWFLTSSVRHEVVRVKSDVESRRSAIRRQDESLAKIQQTLDRLEKLLAAKDRPQ